MNTKIYGFMSATCLALVMVMPLVPEKWFVFGVYKTTIAFTLLAIVFALWDIASAIRRK